MLNAMSNRFREPVQRIVFTEPCRNFPLFSLYKAGLITKYLRRNRTRQKEYILRRERLENKNCNLYRFHKGLKTWIRVLPVSATYTVPVSLSTPTPSGPFNWPSPAPATPNFPMNCPSFENICTLLLFLSVT